jgi:hypothetical protein
MDEPTEIATLSFEMEPLDPKPAWDSDPIDAVFCSGSCGTCFGCRA